MGSSGQNIFEPVTITWQGEDYVIPAEKGMRLAYTVEMALRQDSNLSVFELMQNPPLTTLAMAYGAALRFAGVPVSDEEVMQVLSQSILGDTDDAVIMRGFVTAVFSMLLPPAALRAAEVSDDVKKTIAG